MADRPIGATGRGGVGGSAPFDYNGLANSVKSILAEFSGTLTIRQIYYRMLSTLSWHGSYDYLDHRITRCRERGLVPDDRIADPTRSASWVSAYADEETWQEVIGRSDRLLRRKAPFQTRPLG